MTLAQKRANNEVLVILNQFNLTNKIPQNVLKNIQENQDENWNFIYDDTLELEEQKIQRQTAILFSTLYLMYLCEDEKEKEELKQIYRENEQKSSQNNDFETFIQKVRTENKEENESSKETISNLPVSQKENSLFAKIKRWLKSVLY